MNLRSGRHAALLLSTAFLVGCAQGAFATVDYIVSVQPEQNRIRVDMTIPANGPVMVRIPRWGPGSYVYGDFYKNINEVAADAQGKALEVSHPDESTWAADPHGSRSVHFSYWIPSNNRRFGGRGNDNTFVQISGPATYMYVVDRKTEPCTVSFRVPTGWPVYLGLDEARGKPNTYAAPNYDVLADNPISTGDLIVDTYNLRGKPHYVVLEGKAKTLVDRTRLLHDTRFVSASETDFFGGAPYNKYVWHFSVFEGPDGAGGLEHLSSTQISLSSGEGPRAQSVLAHEFFHLWNVKRTRSKPLGPFNYQELPKTGALWWLEGVTDYYAGILPYRYGLWERKAFYDSIVRNMNAVRANPARLEVSPYESSMRVAEANNGRGNSNGYKISYYNLGWLCGMLLDTEIRAQTNNRHSLDDVTRALFAMCKNGQPGFEEDEIRKQCIRFGGAALGPFYDKVVMTPGEMPIEEQLAKMGCHINEADEHFASVGFTTQNGQNGILVREARGPAEGKLQEGDVLVAVNGQALDDRQTGGRALATQIQQAKVGTPFMLKIKRGDAMSDVQIDPVDATRKVRTVVENGDATPAQTALREGWLFRKTASVQ